MVIEQILKFAEKNKSFENYISQKINMIIQKSVDKSNYSDTSIDSLIVQWSMGKGLPDLTVNDLIDSYATNSYVRSAIGILQNLVANTPVEFYKDEKLIDNPLQEFNSYLNFSEAIEVIIAQYLCAGNYYIYDTPDGLILLPPQRITIECNKYGFPTNYLYDNSDIKDWKAKLIHGKDAHIDKDFIGTPKLAAAKKDIATIKAIQDFIGKWLVCDGHISRVLSIKNATHAIIEQTKKTIAQAIMENSMPVLQDVEILSIKVDNPLTANINEQFMTFGNGIYRSVGVATVLSDSSGATFANMKEAIKFTYINSVMSLCNRLQSDLNHVLKMKKINATCKYNFSEVEYLQADLTEYKRQITADYQAGVISRDEARVLSYDFADPVPVETNEDKLKKSLMIIKKAKDLDKIKKELTVIQGDVENYRLQELAQYFKVARELFSETIAKYSEINSNNIDEIISEIRKTAASYVINLNPIIDDLAKYGINKGALFTKILADKKEITFNIGNAKAKEFVKDIVKLNEKSDIGTLSDIVINKIEQGLFEGWSVGKIANAIKDSYDDTTMARRVAQTVTTQALNKGLIEQGIEYGIKQKQWITMGDDRVRDAHVAMSGEIVKIGDKFSNGLEFPNEIGCRCLSTPISMGG